MTTAMPRHVTCGLCNSVVEVFELASTNRFGSPDLDLRPPPLARHTLEYQISRCPECGFAAVDLSQPCTGDADLVVGDTYRSILESDQPELAKSFACASTLHQARGDDVSASACSLRAAWVCDDEQHAERAVEHRAACAELLTRALDQEEAEAQETVGITVVLIDVLRRARLFDEAMERCRALLADANASDLSDVARFQARLIEQRDDACHKLNELEGR